MTPPARTPEEIRSKADELEKRARHARRQYARNWLMAQADALRWAAGEPSALGDEGPL